MPLSIYEIVVPPMIHGLSVMDDYIVHAEKLAQARQLPIEDVLDARLAPYVCRIIRSRIAPIASRTAISRCLPEARARSRFATLTEARRMISATAPISTNNMGRTLPTSDSCKGSASIDQSDPAG